MVRRPAWLRWALGRGSKRLEALINVLRRREFPAFCCVSEANQETIDFVAGTQSRVIAEIGVYQGHTSELFARYLGGRGELHLSISRSGCARWPPSLRQQDTATS
jgi:hypothetical protein